MAIFTPKVIATALSTGGVSVGGGGAILLKQMPKNYREQLTKEGTYLLREDNEYKAIYEDHKDKDYWKEENDLKDASTADEAKTKLKTYCNGKFQGSVPWISTESYAKTKKKLTDLCTSKGLKSVKARLIQSGKGGWIGESDDDKYKAIFSVYKYYPPFLAWLKAVSGDNSIKQTSKTSDTYTKLKEACVKILAKPHKEVKDIKSFEQVYWWCTELGYTTIKDKIQKKEPGWMAETDESNFETLATRWNNTDLVKTWARKANGSTDESESLSKESIKKLCDTANVDSELSEDDSYQDKYRVIKVVCKKSEST